MPGMVEGSPIPIFTSGTLTAVLRRGRAHSSCSGSGRCTGWWAADAGGRRIQSSEDPSICASAASRLRRCRWSPDTRGILSHAKRSCRSWPLRHSEAMSDSPRPIPPRRTGTREYSSRRWPPVGSPLAFSRRSRWSPTLKLDPSLGLGRDRTVEPIDEPCLALSEQSMPAPPAGRCSRGPRRSTLSSCRSRCVDEIPDRRSVRFDRLTQAPERIAPLSPRVSARRSWNASSAPGSLGTVIATIAPAEGGRRDHQARARNGRRSARYGGKSWASLGDSPRSARRSPPSDTHLYPTGS